MGYFGVPLFQCLQRENKYVQEIMFVNGADDSNVGVRSTKK